MFKYLIGEAGHPLMHPIAAVMDAIFVLEHFRHKLPIGYWAVSVNKPKRTKEAVKYLNPIVKNTALAGGYS
jgi:hypothetical protein